MKVPTSQDLERDFSPPRPKELPHEALIALRDHSKRMFGNRDRLEVAVAITRVQLGKVNATDLHRDIDVAVNRIRAQLLVLESLQLLRKTGSEEGKRMFQRIDDQDPFWQFAVSEYESVVGQYAEDERATSGEPPVSQQRH
jgi:hypothetical protein